MDPGTMMMLASLASGGLGALTGGKARQGSTYGKQGLGTINDILSDIKGMRGAGTQDINQNPQFQQGQDWLMSMFNDPSFFDKFEAPLQRQFQENTVPDLANRFASMGSGGSMGSTAFRNQLGREGSNLSTNIAALRGGMQQQGVNQLQSYAQQPFQNMMQLLQSALVPTQNTYQPPSGGVGMLAGPLASAAGSYWGAGGGRGNQSNNMFAGQSPLTMPQ